jgi:Peptidase family M48
MNGGGTSRMLKYGVAAVLLGLYAAVSAWLVAGEGEAYRRMIAANLPTSAPVVVDESSPPAIPEVEPTATVALGLEPSPAPLPASKEPKAKPPVEHPHRTPVTKHDTTRPSGLPPTSAPTHPSPPPPPIDPFWEEPNQKKFWNLDNLTTEDERQLGRALNLAIRRFHKPLDVGPLPKRLEDAAEPYLKTVARKDVKYTFTVLDCPRMNVFSHPGGYIYVCKGLFDWIAEDEDYALGFILAHEMAHVDQAHAIVCLRDPDVKKLNMPTVPLFFVVAIPGGYLEGQEFEADRWAVERMLKGGRTRYEALAFLRRLEDYAKANEFENDPPKRPNDEPKIPWLDNHIRSHPIPRKRLKELKAVIDRLQKI